jgi:hypothetical protein
MLLIIERIGRCNASISFCFRVEAQVKSTVRCFCVGRAVSSGGPAELWVCLSGRPQLASSPSQTNIGPRHGRPVERTANIGTELGARRRYALPAHETSRNRWQGRVEMS